MGYSIVFSLKWALKSLFLSKCLFSQQSIYIYIYTFIYISGWFYSRFFDYIFLFIVIIVYNMDKSWMQLGRGSPVYMRGIFDFLEFVRLHSPPDNVIHICPCNKCLNRKSVTYEDMYSHLALNGICPSYTTWTWHGENQVQIYAHTCRNSSTT